MNITLGGLSLEQPALPFETDHPELAQDNVTLSGNTFTDYTALRQTWKMRWPRLTEAQYNALYNVYQEQFVSNTVPTLVIPKYSTNSTVRMFINERSVKRDGDCVVDVEIELREVQAVA